MMKESVCLKQWTKLMYTLGKITGLRIWCVFQPAIDKTILFSELKDFSYRLEVSALAFSCSLNWSPAVPYVNCGKNWPPQVYVYGCCI